jgi:hypothetical protein
MVALNALPPARHVGTSGKLSREIKLTDDLMYLVDHVSSAPSGGSRLHTCAEGMDPGWTTGSKRCIETLLHPNRNAAWASAAWEMIVCHLMVGVCASVTACSDDLAVYLWKKA